MTGCGTRNASYVGLVATGELERRAAAARDLGRSCLLCPWSCGVDRPAGARGRCRTAGRASVASFGPHFGEEPPISGRRGSGTIFFSGCNLRCVFCQNYDISHLDEGREVSAEELAEIMLELQMQGCHNINLVSPSHVVAQILEALPHAVERGLVIPLVYNTGGYDSVDTLRLLEGVVDIYLPDIKYADEEVARRLSGPADYVTCAQAAVREMYRQVGDLQVDRVGAATRGIIIRHLVLPGDLGGTRRILSWIAREVSTTACVNIMGQYRPCFEAVGQDELARRPSAEEMAAAYAAAEEAGVSCIFR